MGIPIPLSAVVAPSGLYINVTFSEIVVDVGFDEFIEIGFVSVTSNGAPFAIEKFLHTGTAIIEIPAVFRVFVGDLIVVSVGANVVRSGSTNQLNPAAILVADNQSTFEPPRSHMTHSKFRTWLYNELSSRASITSLLPSDDAITTIPVEQLSTKGVVIESEPQARQESFADLCPVVITVYDPSTRTGCEELMTAIADAIRAEAGQPSAQTWMLSPQAFGIRVKSIRVTLIEPSTRTGEGGGFEGILRVEGRVGLYP